MALKYLFTAHFEDGSSIVQTPEDKSIIEPETRSAFYDVVNHHSRVEWFELQDETGNRVAVDLIDGHFEVNGNSFWIGEEPSSNDTKELVFYRRHRQHFTLGLDEVAHEIRYYVGWKTEDKEALLGVD